MNQIAQRQSTSPRTLEGLKAEVLKLEREVHDFPSRDELVSAAQRIISAYPNAKPSDPQGYVDTMVAYLSKYPRVVLDKISDPRSGIVTRCTFPPVVAEVEEFARPLVDRLCGRLYREREAVEQIEARGREPTEEERRDVGEQVKHLAANMKAGDVPENASHARKSLYPEWMWEEDEKSEEHKRMNERFRRSQCRAGDGIRAHLAKQEPIEDA